MNKLAHYNFEYTLTHHTLSLSNQALNELADVMIASEHYASVDIVGRRKTVS